MLKTIFFLPAELYKNRRLVFKLAKNDFKTKYAGSYLGIVWAFVQPIVTILVYWFVFSVGFRSGTGDLGVPFVLYLVAGIVPWFFFQDALIGGTNSLLEYNYLVKKVVFNISVLPVVKIISRCLCTAFSCCLQLFCICVTEDFRIYIISRFFTTVYVPSFLCWDLFMLPALLLFSFGI